MPELPEVQTIVNFLKPALAGKKILKVEFLSSRITRGQSPHEVKQKLIGQKIINAERVGKWIVLRLSSGECFLLHLMMTGKILLNPKESNKHDRLILKLSGKTKLVFNDIRQFGKCSISTDVKNLVGQDQDALKISFQNFKNLIKSKNTATKKFLLDQKFVAGIGNIYADEILWDAGIHPLRKTKDLKNFEIIKIFKSIKKILKLAIKKGGTSSRDYRKPDNTEGEYYKIRKVYQRTGEKCSYCGGIIKRIVTGGRSTHFCPRHQK